MRPLSITPRITVMIGDHTRQYFAFVTTAPADLDSPSTLTLHASTWSDIAGLAALSIAVDDSDGPTPSRLVLVDAMELAWQRIRGQHHSIHPADPGLVSAAMLQRWLWYRLRAPGAGPVAA